jgi:hypothetical protein
LAKSLISLVTDRAVTIAAQIGMNEIQCFATEF